jgi:Leucine-rich repeat (LRR) protein
MFVAYQLQNQIRKLEGFDYMSELGFLSIFGNQISVVENLKHLNLLYLDAHDNKIEEVDAGLFSSTSVA